MPDASGLTLWTDIDPLEAGAGMLPPALDDTNLAARLITWLRITAPGGGDATLLWAGVNAATVSQQSLVAGEVLSNGTGSPDQTVQLANTPVVPGTVTLQVGGAMWKEVSDLYTAGPEVPVPDLRLPPGAPTSPPSTSSAYTLDPTTGIVTFGDGMHGARPAQEATIRADYAYGAGAAGNVGPASISAGSALPPGVKVTNPIRTWGGADAQSVSEGETQIPRYLQYRDRAVSADDFDAIVRRTPGITIGRLDVIPAFNPELSPNAPGDAAGAVTLMLIPAVDADHPNAPQPDQPFLDAVCAYIDPRRLVTTEVFLRGPNYVPISLSVGFTAVAGYSIATVSDRGEGGAERVPRPAARPGQQLRLPPRGHRLAAAQARAAAGASGRGEPGRRRRPRAARADRAHRRIGRRKRPDPDDRPAAASGCRDLGRLRRSAPAGRRPAVLHRPVEPGARPRDPGCLLMDVNGSRFALLLGCPDWSSCTDDDGAPLGLVCDPGSPPQTPADSGLAWDPTRHELTLQPLPFTFTPGPTDRPPQVTDRRGAGRDSFGSWYWIDPTARSVLVQSSGTGLTTTYWPGSGAAADSPGATADNPRLGAFVATAPVPAPASPPLRGAAVTEDNFLVIGVLDPPGLLVFDLQTADPPAHLPWPVEVAFAPFDMAPRPSGGVFVLDRDHSQVWELDRHFHVFSGATAPPETAPPGSFGPPGDPVSAPASRPQRLSAANATSVPPDVIAIEADPSGGFFALHSGGPQGSAVSRYVDGALVGAAAATAGLSGYDLALVGGRLLMVDADGKQTWAFGLTEVGGAPALELLVTYYPMRQFGGKGLVAAGGHVYISWRLSRRLVFLINLLRGHRVVEFVLKVLLLSPGLPATTTAGESAQLSPVFFSDRVPAAVQ